MTADRSIAILFPGPSLTETWEGARAFSPIMAVKSAHEFLIERGIVPDYAVSTESPSRTKWTKHDGVKYLCGHHETAEPYKGKVIGPPGSWSTYHHHLYYDLSLRRVASGFYAVFCAYMLGFKTMHLFGCDCTGPKKARGQLRRIQRELGLNYIVHGPDNLSERKAA